MDNLRRWRPRRPTGRAGARRAGVTALVLLAVTAGLAVLLAVRYHLTGPTVAVAILGGVPTLAALYLAWAALPGAIIPPEPAVKGPAHGRPARRWDAVDLGVHRVIGGGPMPAYVRRPHDELLEAILDPAVPASRLVVVRGGSSTGKTRAAYQAVTARLADWQLDYPRDPAALKTRLETGIPARTVLWLGELRQYADVDGGADVMGRLADLLEDEGHIVITTLWPEQWNTYTAAVRAGSGPADAAGTAGRLLEPLPELKGSDPAPIDPARGGVIDVRDQFTTDDLEAAAGTGDSVLAAAAAAAASAGQAGQVTQYLAGVPDLLDRYAGPGGDPYGQAVITAAMDATRLGHASPLPATLIQEAAVGYLTGAQRTKDIASWRDAALAWATKELKGAVRALQPISPGDPSSTGVAGYRVADYLDQYGRRTRQDQLGPPSLWDALTAYAASASDLTRLGQAARDRGLYRHASALWTTAAALGSTDSTDAARQLITLLGGVNPGDITRAAQGAAVLANLDNPWTVAWLLGAAREGGASDAVTTLLARDPAAHASLDNPRAVASLLRALGEAGASDAVTTLLARDPAAHASLDNPQAVALLLRALGEAGASDAVTTLATRAAAHASLDNPRAVALLLRALGEAGASDAVTTLLARDPAAHASLDNPRAVAELLRALGEAGASDAVTTLLARDPAAHASLNPGAVAELLGALREAGASDAVTTLATRAAAHASLNNPRAVAELLRALGEAGASDAVTTLATRAAAHASLNPGAVAELLGALRAAGASDAVTTLLARDPAAHASLDNPQAVAELLGALRAAGASDAVTTLATRAAAHASLNPGAVAELLGALRAAGASDAVTTLLARDPAAHASLDNPRAVALLLRALGEAGASDAVTTLLARDPAAHASLDNPQAVAELLGALGEAGASDAVTTLLARDPAAHASLDNPQAVAELLGALGEAGASDAVTTLLARDPAAHASLDNPQAVAELLRALRTAGTSDAVNALASRAANAGMFDLFLEVRPDEAASYRFGREPGGSPSRPWKWQKPVSQSR